MKERIAVIAVLLLAAAACQPGSALPVPSAAPLQPSASPTAGQPPATAPQAAPADLQPTSVPTVREALEATDPTAVVLGAGRPTLVEFFAFW